VNPRTPGRRFLASDIRSIYSYPPVPTTNVVVGVISLGGTLTGNIDANGILTGGDVQRYWTALGMTSQPTVKIVRINGSPMDATDTTSTIENTIDVEMVGACCPTSRLTIIFYFYNQYRTNVDAFYGVFSYAINTPVTIPGLGAVKPSIISCSWGAPEVQFSSTSLAQYNSLFASAAAAGVTITAAAGDHGSSNTVGTDPNGNFVDFPASSPNVVSCGGTHLICPSRDFLGNYIYNGATETTWAWSNTYKDGTGGGISTMLNGPPFPVAGRQRRSVPDISLVADPDTGVSFLIKGANMIVGGTSIVSPAIAGLVACLPRAPKGFLTKLYALPSLAFNDITVGSNGGFTASSGYDACTGLGSVNGDVFTPKYNTLITSPARSVSITGALTALAGTTRQLTASVASWWATSNPAVATVVNGLVTAVSAGSAIITATSRDGFFTASVSFTVTAPLPPFLRISASPGGASVSNIRMRRNTRVLLYSSSPATWTTSNVNVASVSNGLVIASIRPGLAAITATLGTLRATVTVQVI
jgi:subtilase family serine protease